jgi:hypothetical protein
MVGVPVKLVLLVPWNPLAVVLSLDPNCGGGA